MKNINLSIQEPLYLLIIIPLIVLTLIPYFKMVKSRRKKLKYVIPCVLRCIVIVLIALLLADISNEKIDESVTTILLADYSDSTETVREEMERYIEEVWEYSDKDNLIGMVVFADEALYEIEAKEFSKFNKNVKKIKASATNIEEAIEYTSKLIDEDKNGRIVLLSDGLETEGSAINAAKNVAGKNIKLDAVVFDSFKPNVKEVQVTNIEIPGNAVINEEFTVNITVRSTVNTTAVVKYFDNDKEIKTKDVTLTNDNNEITETLITDNSGIHTIKVEVEPKDDSVKQNNMMYSYVNVLGNGNILIVDKNKDKSSNLYDLISTTYNVDVVSPSSVPSTINELNRYDEVILMNIDNKDLPYGYDEILNDYVKNYGKGLLTTGGENTYHYGNMEDTLFEDMLPVKLTVDGDNTTTAIMILLDSSNSMTISGYFSTAQEAAISTINSLNEDDYIGVISFSGTMRVLSGLTSVKNKDDIIKKIEDLYTIQGTYLYEPILEAYSEFQKCDADIKHCILLSDGNPSDSGFSSIIKEMYADGITTSTILIGNYATSNIMYSLSELGGGEFYELYDVSNLEDIMVKEAESKTTSYTKNGDFKVKINDYTKTLSGITEVPNVDGFICTKIKNDAKNVLIDEESSMPIYAEWKYGLGNVGSFTSDMSKEWSEEYYSTDSGKKFIMNVVDKLMTSNSNSSKVRVIAHNRGYETDMEINILDKSADKKVEVTLENPSGDKENIMFNNVESGKYTGIIKTSTEGLYKVEVNVLNSDDTLYETITTMVASSYPMEYDKFLTGGDELLVELTNISGGEVFVNAKQLMSIEMDKLRISESLFVPIGVVMLILLTIDLIIRNINDSTWKRIREIFIK